MKTHPFRAAIASAISPRCWSPGTKRKLKLASLGTLGVLLIGTLGFFANLLHLMREAVPVLKESGLWPWIVAVLLSIAVTDILVWSAFRHALRQTPKRTTLAWVMSAVSVALCLQVWYLGKLALRNTLPRVAKLGLPKLTGPIPGYYGDGARARAEQLQADIREMNEFFEASLGVRAEVTLAVLNSNDWKRVDPIPYGFPNVLGTPPVIFMPAHSGGAAFQMMTARKEAIPVEVLRYYLENSHGTFEAAADDFVDFIAFHELGHVLCDAYGIDPGCHWLSEFVASYFAYTFIAERRPETKPVVALLGRPSKERPKHTTLADFESLYNRVNDYGWYQGMFEIRVLELYPQMGIQFLEDLKRQFPRTAGSEITGKKIAPEVALEKVEAIAPGFQAWARGFRDSPETRAIHR
jgi:hypothetical protein